MSMIDVSFEVAVANGAAYMSAAAFGFMLRRWYDALPAAIALTIAAPVTAIGIRAVSSGETWLPFEYEFHGTDFWLERGIYFALYFGTMLVTYGLAALAAFAGIVRVVALLVALALVVTAAGFAIPALWPDGIRWTPEPAHWPSSTRADIERIEAETASRCFATPAARIDIALPAQDPRPSETEVLRAVPAAFANVPVLETSPNGERGDRRLLTPVESIRTPAFERYVQKDFSVVLTVVVGTEGQVVAAVPVSGPAEHYAAAVNIAERWRFAPYLLEGKPIVVRLSEMYVPIVGPDRPPQRRVLFPAVTDSKRVFVHLAQRSFRTNSYMITIRGDGAVRYQGFANVALAGEHCATIAPEAAARIIAAFRDADFYSLEDVHVDRTSAYRSDVSSAVAISVDGLRKIVVEENSLLSLMPAVAVRLQNLIDDSADVRRWTHGNERTGPSLLAEQWSFSSWNESNQTILTGAAQYGSARAVADMLRLGAPIGDRYGGPLHHATRRRDFDMIRALLASKIDWTQEQLDDALVETAEMGSDEFVTLLLRRGADPNAFKINQPAIAAAAIAGVPDTVATLLAAGADTKTTDRVYGGTALHNVAPFSLAPSAPEVRFEATNADRGKVVRLLVKAGIPLDVRDHWQRTPLNHNHRGYADVTAALIELGANVNTQDSDGSTPLMSTGSAEAVQMLLAAGANPYLADLKGRTAFDLRDDQSERKESKAILATLERWVGAHPAEAQRLREDAKRIGTSNVPKKFEPEPPDVRDITPISHPGYDGPIALVFALTVIAQMLIVYALTRVVPVRFGGAG